MKVRSSDRPFVCIDAPDSARRLRRISRRSSRSPSCADRADRLRGLLRLPVKTRTGGGNVIALPGHSWAGCLQLR